MGLFIKLFRKDKEHQNGYSNTEEEVTLPFDKTFYENYLSKLGDNKYLHDVFFEAGKFARDNKNAVFSISKEDYNYC